MPRRRTWITLAAVLALLAVLAAVVAPRLLDQARLRAEVERRLTDALGRPVSVRGPVIVTAGPSIDVDVSGVTVRGFADIERVLASVSAASLVSGPLEIGAVRLQAPRFTFAVDAAGRGSWEGLGGPADPKAPARAWTLESLTIERGTLRYTDARRGADYALADWTLEVGRVALPAPVDVRTSFRVASRGATLGIARIAARVRAAPAESRYAVENLEIDGEFARAGTRHRFAGAADRLEYAGGPGTAAVAGLRASALGTTVRVDGTATALATTPRIDATFASDPFVPRAVLSALDVSLPPMRGPDAFARASVRGRLAGTADALAIEALDATLDATRLTGRAERRASRTPGAAGGWRFELAADRLAVDRYLKPDRLRDDSPVVLPLDLLKSLDVAGTLRVGELVAAGVTLRNVTIDLDGDPKK